MTQTMLTSLAVILVAMLALWIISLVRRDASLVDAFWGAGFVIVAWTSWSLNSPAAPRVLILAVLTSLWGLRLSLFLLWRNLGHGEDRRYAAMRAHHGSRFWRVSLFTVFLLQGAILWFVSLPIQIAAARNLTSAFAWLDGAGIALWSIGLFFEVLGDWQLASFKANPDHAGKVMDRGLWRFTRHPNYFGDFCIWWGLYLIAAAGGAAWTAGSPLLMSLLLMRISGVTLLERNITDRRPDYDAYQTRTNAFFPGPPKAA
jgi:steroid 5-alpha reductase family enzyme